MQVRVRDAQPLSLDALQRKLAPAVSDLRANAYMLRFKVDHYEVSVFPDARAIIQGTDDETVARAIYARYIGS